MPRLAHALALALSLATSEAAIQGFNYGSTNADGSNKYQADFESAFSTAKNLVGTSGFTSARLYTMIQGGTTNTPIEAIPAAIAQDTSLLLGLWTSGGNIDNELAALQSAITQYGEDFAKLVVGISVGSEDLYRDSIEGEQSDSGVGLGPDELVSYISQVRSVIAGTSLSGASIGHVDTWTAWVNSSNAEVINALDWIGFDGYPYFQSTMSNSIDDAKELFNEAVAATQDAAGGKPVWITETGWPVSGKTENLAVPSIANAKTYWDEVGCPLFGNTNVWWYTLQDADSVTPNPSFGIVGSTLSTTPLFDLSCSNVSSASSAAASSTVISASSTLATGVAATATGSAGVPSSGSPAGVPPSGSSAGVSGSGARPAASSSATTSVALFGGSSGSSGSAASSAVAGSVSAAVSSRPVSVPSKGPVASSSSPFITTTASGSSKTSSVSSKPSSSVSTLPISGASTLSGSVFGAVAALFVFIAAL